MRNQYEQYLYELFGRVQRYVNTRPLNLGGYTTISGGGGGPPGGFTGYLPQTRVTYDSGELESMTVPPSGSSLLNNLNRIRYRLAQLESVSGSGTGDIATDDIWVALGDLAVGLGPGDATVLSVGNDGEVLSADSGSPTGLKWITISGIAVSGSGTGDVVGPNSSVNNNFASFDGTDGKLLKDSGYDSADFAIAGHTHAQLHDAATILDSSTIDFSISGQQISGAVIASGIKLDDLGAPDNNTDLNVTTTYHGLVPILPNDSTKFLDGTGNWTVVSGSGTGDMLKSVYDTDDDGKVDNAEKLTTSEAEILSTGDTNCINIRATDTNQYTRVLVQPNGTVGAGDTAIHLYYSRTSEGGAYEQFLGLGANHGANRYLIASGDAGGTGHHLPILFIMEESTNQYPVLQMLADQSLEIWKSLDVHEMTTPGSPASDVIRIYCRDNGSGVSKLYYKRSDGTEVELGKDVTVTDSSTIDLSITGQQISGDVIPGGIKLDDLGAPDNNTDLNASSTRHGLLPILPNDSTKFLNGMGNWVTVSGLSGGSNGLSEIYVDQAGGTSDTYGILSGDRDGENTEFTVSQLGYSSGKLLVYLNGQLLTQGSSEDWTETIPASGIFTFTSAPSTNDEITAVYTVVSSGSGGISTDTLWNSKGDLVVGTGTDTATILSVGSEGQVLTVASGSGTGLEWATPTSGGITCLGYASVLTNETINPDNTNMTAMTGMSVSFTLSATKIIKVTFTSIKTGAHPDRYEIYDGDSTKILPSNASSTYYDIKAEENNIYGISISTYFSLGAGAHTIKIFQSAALSTASITYRERFLIVEQIG